MADEHVIKFWRGKRSTYNNIAAKDFWTRYSVIEPDGTITEIFGDETSTSNKRLIARPTGQLLPVHEIVMSLDDIENPVEGYRYLVGYAKEEEGDYVLSGITPLIYTVKLDDDGQINEDASHVEVLEEGIGVRIASRAFKNFVVVDGALVTYDDVNCGTF